MTSNDPEQCEMPGVKCAEAAQTAEHGCHVGRISRQPFVRPPPRDEHESDENRARWRTECRLAFIKWHVHCSINSTSDNYISTFDLFHDLCLYSETMGHKNILGFFGYFVLGAPPTGFGIWRGPVTPPGPAVVRMDRKDLNSNKTKTNKLWDINT